jgi:ligand-binding sensor domain-containing protein
VIQRLLLFVILLTGFSNLLKAYVRESKHQYTTIHVDARNRIWIGTTEGLLRWKNHNTENVRLPEKFHITAIASIDNHLIIGTQNGHLICYNHKTNKIIGRFLLKAEISDICAANESIYITTQGVGIIRVNLRTYTHWHANNILNDNFISRIRIDPKGMLWAATDRGIQCIDINGRVKALPISSGIPDRLVTCLDLKDSLLLCGTQQGDLCEINLNTNKIHCFDKKQWHGAQLNDVRYLDRSIAIGSNKGAYVLSKTGVINEQVDSIEKCTKLTSDREGSIWFCSENSIQVSLHEQIKFVRHFFEANGIVHALITDKNGNLYVSYENRFIKYNWHTRKIIQSTMPFAPNNYDINTMFLGQYGRIWIGTSGNGLYTVDTATLYCRKVAIDRSVEHSGILSITGDQNTIWVSSLNGVWYSPIDSQVLKFRSLEDQYKRKKYYVYQVKKDSRNNVWLATDGQGILLLKNHEMQNFSQNMHIRNKVFYGIEEDGIGQIWFNASNDGLYCLRNDRIVHLNSLNGLSSNDILSICAYRKNFLIAVTSMGIDIIQVNNFTVSQMSFNSRKFKVKPIENAIISHVSNQIMIGTETGLIRYYLPSYKTIFGPSASIEHISVMEQSISPNQHLFEPDENYFRFKIGGILNHAETIYYRYRLLGLSDQWTVTIDKEVVYPRLMPGKYIFELETANNSSFFHADSERYDFIIKQPFYKQLWFIVSGLLSLMSLIWLLIRFRERRISRVQQLEKEKAIAEFETLKNQVNPHFLFNSFNTLIQVIDEDKEKAIEYTQMLSDYYRSLIRYRDEDLVHLDEEIMLLEKYIYLQKMRFGDSLVFINSCQNPELAHIQIPPLTLQLLAENAIKHNVVSQSKPLQIEIRFDEHFVVMSNNLNPKLTKEAGEHLGLKNIKNRYALFSRKSIQIVHTQQLFEVRLPLLTN